MNKLSLLVARNPQEQATDHAGQLLWAWIGDMGVDLIAADTDREALIKAAFLIYPDTDPANEDRRAEILREWDDSESDFDIRPLVSLDLAHTPEPENTKYTILGRTVDGEVDVWSWPGSLTWEQAWQAIADSENASAREMDEPEPWTSWQHCANETGHGAHHDQRDARKQ